MTRAEFITSLKELKLDFEKNGNQWENKSIPDFLEAMVAYTEDIQGYYDNMDIPLNADRPSWENFLVILRGAAVYE